jgi:hypothetical protein
MNNLNTKAFGGLLFLILAMAALLFLPAQTIHYWQAWISNSRDHTIHRINRVCRDTGCFGA